jgi:rhodanese-related sulfurtransferase
MIKKISKSAILLITLLSLAATAFASDPFVLRPKYPDVKPIEMEVLASQYDQDIIVDVRSAMEFDVVHVAKAINLPVTKNNFLAELEKVRAKDAATPVVFYCNGFTCAKSYKASQKAQDAGFKNVFCFDAGIFEWVSAYPEKGALLGKTPVDTSKLISKQKLNERKIDFADFKAKAKEKNSVVVDLRDPFQRAKDATLDQNKNVDLKGIRNIPMDRFAGLVKKGEFKNKQLLIFDAVGKQVRWLQYHLEDAGYQDYYFLAKGVLSAAEAGAVK